MNLLSRFLIFIITCGLIISASPLKADNFLRVYASRSGTQDTVGLAEHFLAFGIKIPVFMCRECAVILPTAFGQAIII